MSEIFVDTIKNKAGSTSLDSDKLPDMYSGSAKTYCNFDGSGTVGFNSTQSLNVSSATDNGTGSYQFNMSSAFTSHFFANSGHLNTGSNYANITLMDSNNVTSSMFPFFTGYVGTTTITKSDYGLIPITIHGDLA